MPNSAGPSALAMSAVVASNIIAAMPRPRSSRVKLPSTLRIGPCAGSPSGDFATGCLVVIRGELDIDTAGAAGGIAVGINVVLDLFAGKRAVFSGQGCPAVHNEFVGCPEVLHLGSRAINTLLLPAAVSVVFAVA